MSDIKEAERVYREKMQQEEEEKKKREIRLKMKNEEKNRKERQETIEKNNLYKKEIATLEKKIYPDRYFNEVYELLCNDEASQNKVIDQVGKYGLPLSLFTEWDWATGGYNGFFKIPWMDDLSRYQEQKHHAIKILFSANRSKKIVGGKLDGFILRSEKYQWCPQWRTYLLILEKPSVWNLWGSLLRNVSGISFLLSLFCPKPKNPF